MYTYTHTQQHLRTHAMLTLSPQRMEFIGATGSMSLDSNGDRSVAGAPFVIRNVQLTPPAAGARRASSTQPVQFVRVGTITQACVCVCVCTLVGVWGAAVGELPRGACARCTLVVFCSPCARCLS